MLTILAVGTLLRPSSLPLFSGMLLSSIVYNVAKWPFVVNHILLETIINATILGAIIATLLGRREFRHFDDKFRMEVFQRFSPVIWIMLVTGFIGGRSVCHPGFLFTQHFDSNDDAVFSRRRSVCDEDCCTGRSGVSSCRPSAGYAATSSGQT